MTTPTRSAAHSMTVPNLPMTVIDRFLPIDHSSAVPLYHQIKEAIQDLIEGGELPAGTMLPSERELAEHYAVSRLTVRQAISELVRDGLLLRQHGIGTFVAPPKLNQAQPMALSFTQRMIQAGRVPTSRVLAREIIPAPRGVARRLQIEPDTPVMRITRLRLADGQPVMLETTHLPAARFPGLLDENLQTQSLYAILSSRYGVVLAEAEQTLEPVVLTAYEAAQLGAAEGTPAMLVEVVALSAEGWPVEYSRSIVRGDTSRYVFRLRNVDDNHPAKNQHLAKEMAS